MFDDRPPAEFAPISREDGYLPLADYGLIGDGRTAALVGRDGAVDFLCVPRFDAPPLFCGLLDAQTGGSFTVALDPRDGRFDARQGYELHTAVLVTEMRGPRGVLRITDALVVADADLRQTQAAARGALVRVVRALAGHPRVAVRCRPFVGAGADVGAVALRADRDVGDARDAVVSLQNGEELVLSLSFGGDDPDLALALARDHLEDTRRAWSRWTSGIANDTPAPALVERSAITLKLLHSFEHGAVIAAPTTSLPERLGGARNWDYRYSWVRDAAFAADALRDIGLEHEMTAFVNFVQHAAMHDGRPLVVYAVDGAPAPDEETLSPTLEGYRKSAPVRIGNAAVHQTQNDVLGEVVDCVHFLALQERSIEPETWRRVRRLVETARRAWREPAAGIWEMRGPRKSPFVYSVARCRGALLQGADMAELLHLPADVDGWREEAERIEAALTREGFDEEVGAFVSAFGEKDLDASVLALPVVGLIDARDPRMLRTRRTIEERLGAGDGLLFRYSKDETDDGVGGAEGAFVLCSFWFVEDLALAGEIDRALELFESLVARASPLGLYAEEIDPSSGALVGNFPQGLSHVGVISAAVALARATAAPSPSKRERRRQRRAAP